MSDTQFWVTVGVWESHRILVCMDMINYVPSRDMDEFQSLLYYF